MAAQNGMRRMVGAPDPINSQRFATQRPFSPEDLSQPLYDRKQNS